MSLSQTIVLVLCGGEGKRLYDLTTTRSKPAVPFGGKYRIIDFQLSNVFNSGLKTIMLLVQHQAQGLIDHAQDYWPSEPRFDFSVHTVPPQSLLGSNDWYRGTADAVYQNMPLVQRRGKYKNAFILAGDHITVIDYSQMIAWHEQVGSIFTISSMPILTSEAHRFGVLEVNSDGRVVGFEEKPEFPKEIPGRPGWSLVSLGNYCADLSAIEPLLNQVVTAPGTTYDFGKDLIPLAIEQGLPVWAYDYLTNKIDGQNGHYWMDVGTIDAYHEASMDLVSIVPKLNVANPEWKIRMQNDILPGAKFTKSTVAQDFMLAGGCLIQGASLNRVIAGREVRIYDGSLVSDSVIFNGVVVGHHCRLRRCIIDRHNDIPPGTVIGENPKDDQERFTVSPGGIIVVPRGYKF